MCQFCEDYQSTACALWDLVFEEFRVAIETPLDVSVFLG
ncbi:hypothetical protein SEA_SQUINT_176 [Mycobacterium phage Squint]|nr:hypothetical protein SEA_SQUINT_176 [Mycobacterium phage Squint]